MDDEIKKLEEIIDAAVNENDLEKLNALEQEWFAPGTHSIAPFAPSLTVNPNLADSDLMAENVSVVSASHGGSSNWIIRIANRIARGKRRVKFFLKTVNGFEGHIIVSEGDSWFQYPRRLEDVIDFLSEDDDKAILSFGEAGDVLSSIARRQEYLSALNRINASAFLLSAAGNDLLGDGALLRVLHRYEEGMGVDDLINNEAFNQLMQQIETDYRRIIEAVFQTRPGIQVFGHGYDLPMPRRDGVWIGQPLRQLGIPFDVGRHVVEHIMRGFVDLLRQFEQKFDGFHLVDTLGAVGSSHNSWEDEIHPKDAGFGRVAERFRAKISETLAPVSLAVPTAVSVGRAESASVSAATHSEKNRVPVETVELARVDRSTSSLPDRTLMARQILNFEARRDPATGHLMVYHLHPDDGGGRYEVAGINEKYHKDEADHLVALIEAELFQEAEDYATEFIASYTDRVDRWCRTLSIESYLRDCMFNRGPSGSAWILQHAVGVNTDRIVGPITRRAIAAAEAEPSNLLDRLRASREVYERKRRDESSRYWRGLVNRWNNALTFAKTFLAQDSMSVMSMSLQPPQSADPKDVRRILNCRESKDVKDDWSITAAFDADVIRYSPIPEEFDLREDWWPIGDQYNTGSCVGWATADSVLRWHFVNSGRLGLEDRLSVRFIWVAAKETDTSNFRPTTFIEDSGTTLKAALDIARKLGSVTDDVLPFDRRQVFTGRESAFYARAARLKINSYHNLNKRENSQQRLDDWRRWICQSGPILTRLNVDRAFQNAKNTGGHLTAYDPSDKFGGHAVALVGYTPEGFIIRNSWSENWGDRGFAYASNNYAHDAFTEAYGVTT